MKKQMIALAVSGVMAVGGVFGVAAAGVGYVNTQAIFQAHPKMAKAELDLKAEQQKAQQKFEKEVAKLQNEEAQRQLFTKMQGELAQKEQAIMTPIQKDVLNAIEKTRKEKDLDVVVEQAAVVAGGTDITEAVAQNLK